MLHFFRSLPLCLVLGIALFAPSLRAAPADANPRGVATFECIGLYWRTDEAGECRVRFRPAGTDRWQDALPLVHDPRDHEYRGSLVGLAPGSDYDIELITSRSSTSLAVRTRSDRFPIGKTTHVPAGETSTPVVITESGTPDAYDLVPPATPTSAAATNAVTALPSDSDFDYGLFTGTDKGDATERLGVLTTRIHHLFLSSLRLEFYPPSIVTQIRGGKIPVKFGAAERMVTDPVPQVPSPLIDRGQPLSNFNDGFTGQAADLGAFEVGRPSRVRPPRVSALRRRLGPMGALLKAKRQRSSNWLW